MKKKVLLNIKSIQNSEDEDKNKIEIDTHGEFYKTGENFYISYLDSEATGFKDHKTIIKVNKDIVTINRKGKYSSKLVMNTKAKTICKYPNFYGVMVLGISDVKICSNLSDNGGDFEVNYKLDINDNSICKTNLKVYVNIL